jgi:hypothetical protein
MPCSALHPTCRPSSRTPGVRLRAARLVSTRACLVLPALAWMFVAVGMASAADAPPKTDAEQLVEQLGDVEFGVRERATNQLVALGLPALDALRAGAEHPDREIRYRSQRILAIVQDLDFESRLEAFIADRDSERDYDLPGWKKYRSFVGDNESVRELFVEMQRAEPELLRAVEQGPKATTDLLNKRVQQIQESMQLHRNQLVVNLGTITSLLFAALEENVAVAAQPSQLIANFLYQPSFNNAVQGGGGRPLLLRQMLGEWIRRRTNDLDGYQSMMLALRYDVKEGLVPAERALRQAESQINQPSNAHLRQYGILTVARFGGPENLSILEPLLEDKTNYGGQIRINNVNYRTQIRDIALAALVKLSGQDLADYGFARVQMHPQYVFNASTLAFADDEKRDEAIQRWRDYRLKAAAAKPDADGEPADHAKTVPEKEGPVKEGPEKEGPADAPPQQAPPK